MLQPLPSGYRLNDEAAASPPAAPFFHFTGVCVELRTPPGRATRLPLLSPPAAPFFHLTGVFVKQRTPPGRATRLPLLSPPRRELCRSFFLTAVCGKRRSPFFHLTGVCVKQRTSPGRATRLPFSLLLFDTALAEPGEQVVLNRILIDVLGPDVLYLEYALNIAETGVWCCRRRMRGT